MVTPLSNISGGSGFDVFCSECGGQLGKHTITLLSPDRSKVCRPVFKGRLVEWDNTNGWVINKSLLLFSLKSLVKKIENV